MSRPRFVNIALKMAQKRYLNLVFQGGGIRGMAYAGVLDKMPAECEPYATAGTSAGAIVAALMAIGERGADLKKRLSDKDLYSLLDVQEAQRFSRMSYALAEFRPLLTQGKNGVKIAKFGLWRWSGRHTQALKDAADVWAARGLYRSDRLRTWLDKVFGKTTFDQIKLADLRIMASDVSLQDYVVYTKRTHPGEFIAAAVHASVNIPLFFTPYLDGNRHLVDGGLLSNYPSFLFAQGGYPTIGFRLSDINPLGPIGDTLGYLKGLLLTMAEAHDKQRPLPKRFKSYLIETPPDLPAAKFDLTPSDGERLFEAGQKAADKVQWNHYSSSTPHVPYYDPSPDDALELSMSQACELRDQFYQAEQYVDGLEHIAEFELRIESDWSTTYYRDGTLQVRGPKPLFLSRMGVVGTAELKRLIPSLVDTKMICEEVTTGRERELIHIPVENGEAKKGFIVCYVPPISEGDGIRKFRTGFRIPSEFATSVAVGREDVASYSVVQQAVDHGLTLTFRILVDSELPELVFSPEFGLPMKPRAAVDDKMTGRIYRGYECRIPRGTVHAKSEFRVRINKKTKA
jgi:NTE family protein